MAVSAFTSIRELVRKSIRDLLGLVWDDTALDYAINEAQREYAILSGSLVGSVTVPALENGVFSLPDDFLVPIKFIDTKGYEVPFYSWRNIHAKYPDFRKVTGTELQAIITDFDGYGKLRLFPVLPESENVGTLYYQRLPQKDKLETKNVRAIELHSLFQAFMIDANPSASVYYNQFAQAVNEENAVQRGMKTKSRLRRGRFF